MAQRANRELLSTYLNDHWAGAAAGKALARQIRRRNAESPWGSQLAWLARQIAEDDATLRRLRRELDVDGGGFKRAIGGLLERLAQVKLSGPGPLSRVLQAESLVSGLAAKHLLWAALRNGLPADTPAVAEFDFPELERRAEEQMEVLRRFHEQAAVAAFQAAGDHFS